MGVNIEIRTLDEINRAAGITCRSRTNIIRHLLTMAVKDNQALIKSNGGIKYQDRPACPAGAVGRDESNIWHKFHIVFRNDEYEYCLDMRKLFKMSLSRILAYAVVQYLSEIIHKLTTKSLDRKADNYLFKNYLMVQNMTNGVFCWHIYWGIPPEIEKIF